MNIYNAAMSWDKRDKAAWETAAVKLEAEGFVRHKDSYWPAVFRRDDTELVLVRGLGSLNWYPRER